MSEKFIRDTKMYLSTCLKKLFANHPYHSTKLFVQFIRYCQVLVTFQQNTASFST